MPRDTPPALLRTLVAVSRDPALLAGLRTGCAGSGFELLGLSCGLEDLERIQTFDDAAIAVVDFDPSRPEQLAALQKLATRLEGRCPLVVLTNSFDDGVARHMLQLKVRDFLRKPVAAEDVLRCCDTALLTRPPASTTRTDVLAFIPAAGGVGNTTMAIEAAMQLAEGRRHSVCLVDLDFHNNACADFLDLEPRLDLHELGPVGERLDLQLLEVMVSRHASGVSLLATPARPGEPCDVDPQAISRILDVCAQRFDRLVIDLPRHWTSFTDDVLGGSDRVFIVTDMTVPGLRCGRRLASRLDERLGPATTAKVIVNRFQASSLFGSGLRKTDVERALGPAYAGPVANNYALVREAIDRGVPLSSVKPGNRTSADLSRILAAR